MSFLYRSSSLEGGKTISSAEAKKCYSFYVSALRNASDLKGIVYLARYIRSDSNLFPADRELLMGYAQSLCAAIPGFDLEAVL
jgi:hypothetical protein